MFHIICLLKTVQVTLEDDDWSEPEQGLKEGEIIWQMAYERGTYYSRKGYYIDAYVFFSSSHSMYGCQ